MVPKGVIASRRLQSGVFARRQSGSIRPAAGPRVGDRGLSGRAEQSSKLGNGAAASTYVLLAGYKGTDGKVVVGAIHQGDADAAVPIAIAGGAAPATLTPWITSAMDNLASKTAVPATGGTFMAALLSKTVTTFVGK